MYADGYNNVASHSVSMPHAPASIAPSKPIGPGPFPLHPSILHPPSSLQSPKSIVQGWCSSPHKSPSPSPREGSSASDGLLLSSTGTDASARHALLDAMCGLLGRVADHRAASVALQGRVSTAHITRSTQYAMRTDLEGLGHGEVALVAFADMSRQVTHRGEVLAVTMRRATAKRT